MSSATIARDEALQRVSDNAAVDWKALALDAIQSYVRSGNSFTTDALWEVLKDHGVTTHEPRAMGAVIKEAQRRGWIKPQGWTQSTRKECHARPVRVWRAN